VESALQELSISSARTNDRLVAAFAPLNAYINGSVPLPGLPLPAADAGAIHALQFVNGFWVMVPFVSCLIASVFLERVFCTHFGGFCNAVVGAGAVVMRRVPQLWQGVPVCLLGSACMIGLLGSDFSLLGGHCGWSCWCAGVPFCSLCCCAKGILLHDMRTTCIDTPRPHTRLSLGGDSNEAPTSCFPNRKGMLWLYMPHWCADQSTPLRKGASSRLRWRGVVFLFLRFV
jgi:hypothetical protein